MSRTTLLQLGIVLCLLFLSLAALIYNPSSAHGAAMASVISTLTNMQVTSTHPQAITLSWSTSVDSSGTGDVPAYYVYEGANIVATSMGMSVTVSSLLASTVYTFTVQAYDMDSNRSASTPAAGAATTSITMYVHGWYAQSDVSVDDVSLS